MESCVHGLINFLDFDGRVLQRAVWDVRKRCLAVRTRMHAIEIQRHGIEQL